MGTMISEVYDAFREAGTSEEKARKAAETLANYEDRFQKIDIRFEKIEGELAILKYMVSFNLALTTAVLIKLFIG